MVIVRRTSLIFLLQILLINIFTVTACSPTGASVTVTTTLKSKTESPIINDGKNLAYPAPSGASQNGSYPAPDTNSAQGEINNLTPMPVGALPHVPEEALLPQAGKGSISGVVFSFTTRIILPDTQFYLTPGWGSQHKDPPIAFTGPDKSRGDYIGTTNQQGEFNINDVPPGDYYFAVWAPLSWSVAVVSNVDTQPRLIHVGAEQKLPLGVVYVSWP